MEEALDSAIRSGLAAIGCSVDLECCQRIRRYLLLLEKWNRSFNLTAVRDPLQMVPRHVLDSAAVLPFIKGRRVLDVGTGAGLPGMVLALLDTERKFCLLDSNGKKIRFLTQVSMELGLDNVALIRERMERYKPERGFSTVIARALGSIGEVFRSSRHLLEAEGILLVMQSRPPYEELDALREAGIRSELTELHVPGLRAERSLVAVENPR